MKRYRFLGIGIPPVKRGHYMRGGGVEFARVPADVDMPIPLSLEFIRYWQQHEFGGRLTDVQELVRMADAGGIKEVWIWDFLKPNGRKKGWFLLRPNPEDLE